MTVSKVKADPELEDILNRIQTLSITAEQSGLQGRDRLAMLNEDLKQWYEVEGLSMTKFKQVVQDSAICLSDLKHYHSRKALRRALKEDPSKIVPRAHAKQFKYVKMCLVIL